MTTAERDKRNFLQRQLDDLKTSRYAIKSTAKEPTDIRVARKLVARYDRAKQAAVDRRRKILDRHIENIRELLVFGKYEQALKAIKAARKVKW